MLPPALLAVAAAIAVALLSACRPPEAATAPSGSPGEAPAARAAEPALEPMLPPVQKVELAPGSGAEAKQGDRVLVHYQGTLTDGTQFDSSLERGQPFEFTIGAGMVIPGWDIGVTGMKKGQKVRLTVPPHLGYGSRGVPPKIPPEATLVFEVELVEIL